MHEVDRPAFVRPRYRRNNVAAHVAHFALLPRAYLQCQAAIDAPESELADVGTTASDHDEQPAPAPTRSLLRQRLDPLGKRAIVFGFPR